MDQYSQTRCRGAYMRAVTSALLGVFLSRVPFYEDKTVCLRFWSINPCDPVRLSALIQTCFLGISQHSWWTPGREIKVLCTAQQKERLLIRESSLGFVSPSLCRGGFTGCPSAPTLLFIRLSSTGSLFMVFLFPKEKGKI